ncbi:MAG: Rad52/Rad22 family DNA repair protein [Candidatus Limnocylindrus sp.]
MTDQKTIAAALAAPFKPEELKSRPGRGGNTFTYVDARSVAQRLDDVLGIDGWQFEVQVADLARHVVKGTLTVVIGGKSVQREDFGYPNGAEAMEPLKEGATDALRRCAARFGVGSLYTNPTQTPLSVAPARLPARSSVPVADELAEPRVRVSAPIADEQAQIALAAAMLFGKGLCPEHDQAWELKPAGVSKATGKPYSAFWSCSGRTDGKFCKQKPSIDWINAQATAAPAPAPVEETLADLPF